ncbi:hypothetical protein P170DRAFT_157130 [Aspergillus steynii IBT 23096]|uniref:Uncharacterized protein n=1 Tax=Aspergillus steynii IBT 23096 TaxID=1392250 RepID=A0A2I2GDI9_9EURO|nr:uncharacterized protein P170DRAFT_157130 [Aspergillus steynii IBT 23096]PLB50958.1 hypothetical protein P170DRAFT_157130 [Aspergillus steynii IBT 23096]
MNYWRSDEKKRRSGWIPIDGWNPFRLFAQPRSDLSASRLELRPAVTPFFFSLIVLGRKMMLPMTILMIIESSLPIHVTASTVFIPVSDPVTGTNGP